MNTKLICSRDKITSIADALRARTNTSINYSLDAIGGAIPNIGNKNIINITNLTPGEIIDVTKDLYQSTVTADSTGVARFVAYELGTYNFVSRLTGKTGHILLVDTFSTKLTRLPLEYQEVEYINNGPSGYIITDIYPTGNDKIYFKAKASSLSEGGNLPMFGNYHNGSNTADFVFYLGKTNSKFYYWQNGSQRTFSTASVANKLFEAVGDYKDGIFSVTIDGNKEEQTQTPNTFTCANKMPLFARYSSGYGGVQQYDFYECKYWRNNELISHFIPAKRLSDNVAGVYDIANSGKNIYDQSKVVKNYYISATGVITSGTAGVSSYSGAIKVIPGETYTFSGISGFTAATNRIHGYTTDNTNSWVQQITTYASTKDQTFTHTFTIPSGINYIRISSALQIDTNDMFELGTSATSYEAFPFYTNAGTGEFTAGPEV